MTRHLRLGAFLNGSGPQGSAWRTQNTDLKYLGSFQYYLDIAQKLEEGKFDILFMNDTVGLASFEAELIEKDPAAARWDTLTLLAGLAVSTSHIGLVGTANTTYNEPFTLARRLESLDRLSNGRAGWNIVTSLQGGENFNRDDHVTHDLRYERAEEFVDVIKGLFDTWDDNAFVGDKESGRWFDASRIRQLNHKGKYFQVRGPLNAPRPIQGRPVFAQAGSSSSGLKLGARVGEVIFTAATTLEEAKAFRAEIRRRAELDYGRDPDSLVVMPGVGVTVAQTKQEAERKFDKSHLLKDPKTTLKALSEFIGLGIDLSTLPLDEILKLPDAMPPTDRHRSRQKLVTDLIRREQPTLRQLLRLLSFGGHRVLIGSAHDVADNFEEWFREGAADGFNIMTIQTPEAISDFVELVVPELQRRNLFKTTYTGKTLRESLGLARPVPHFSEA